MYILPDFFSGCIVPCIYSKYIFYLLLCVYPSQANLLAVNHLNEFFLYSIMIAHCQALQSRDCFLALIK